MELLGWWLYRGTCFSTKQMPSVMGIGGMCAGWGWADDSAFLCGSASPCLLWCLGFRPHNMKYGGLPQQGRKQLRRVCASLSLHCPSSVVSDAWWEAVRSPVSRWPRASTASCSSPSGPQCKGLCQPPLLGNHAGRCHLPVLFLHLTRRSFRTGKSTSVPFSSQRLAQGFSL